MLSCVHVPLNISVPPELWSKGHVSPQADGERQGSMLLMFMGRGLACVHA